MAETKELKQETEYVKPMTGRTTAHSYDPELINETNVERYELTKTGLMQFSHPDGTHDETLWGLALTVYVSRPEIPEYHPCCIVW